jgi:hypothetical protein
MGVADLMNDGFTLEGFYLRRRFCRPWGKAGLNRAMSPKKNACSMKPYAR